MSDQTGLFLACYRVSRNLPGGATLNLRLVVDAPRQSIGGEAHLTQAVNPPTDITVNVTGNFVENEGAVVAKIQGAIPGAAVSSLLEFPKGWGENGEALQLSWLANNHYFHDTNVPAEVIDCHH